MKSADEFIAAALETSLTARQTEVERLKAILKQQQREIPAGYLCPITLDPMEDPVMAADGHSYERSEINAWFARGHNTSPKTGGVLPHQFLMPRTVNGTGHTGPSEFCATSI